MEISTNLNDSQTKIRIKGAPKHFKLFECPLCTSELLNLGVRWERRSTESALDGRLMSHDTDRFFSI